MAEEKNSDLVEIGALWRSSSKNGVEYLSGKMGSKARLLVFPVREKKSDNSPDYTVFLARDNKAYVKSESANNPSTYAEMDNEVPF